MLSNTIDETEAVNTQQQAGDEDELVAEEVYEVESLVGDVAKHLAGCGHPCCNAWRHQPVAIEVEVKTEDGDKKTVVKEVLAWTVAPAAENHPPVSVTVDGELAIGWSPRRVGHVLSHDELVASDRELIGDIQDGLEWLIERDYPQEPGID